MQAFRWLIFLALALGIAGCDHATKVIAATALPEGHSVPLLANVLSLEHARNTDTGFSLLSGIIPIAPRLLLLKATATLGTFFIAALALVRFRSSPMLERVGFACMLGGAVGNAVDRWRWGYVIDFIRLEYWPIFNVADVALCIGGVLLFGSAWQASRGAATVSDASHTGSGPKCP